MIRILVNGSEGQIAQELLELSKTIYNPHLDFIFLNKINWDITDMAVSEKIVQAHKPQYIINTAAYTKVDLAESNVEFCYKINATAPSNLAQLCKENDIKLIHFSSDYIFDDNILQIPIVENHPKSPRGVYAKSKSLAEDSILKINSNSLIIRSSWIYSSYGHNFVKTMLRLGLEKKDLNIVNDQIGSPTYAANIAELVLDILLNAVIRNENLSGIFHYANSGSCTWYEFALKIFEFKGINVNVHPITTKEFNAAAPRPIYSVLNCNKIKETLNLTIPHWADSLKLCLSKID
ncbi:MAG: dTDP-4-dehydrorhamnose reductase [Saprospiraceae bacterium]